MKKRIGIDIGGVLISKDTDSEACFFSDDYRKAGEVPGSLFVLQQGLSLFDRQDMFLISKCSPSVEAKTRQWLEYRFFFEEIGILPGNVLFCRDRAEKAVLADRLRLNYFVDDRFSVLKHMLGIPSIESLFLFCPRTEERPSELPAKVQEVPHWFWIESYFAGGIRAGSFPLPPKWSFIDEQHSQDLSDRFFVEPNHIRFLMRSEEDAFIQIGEQFFAVFLNWDSDNKIELEKFLQTAVPLDRGPLIEQIYQREESWFGWPSREHPVWDREGPTASN